MATGGTPPTGAPEPGALETQRQSRWLGQEYADMTKLREISARHAHTAARAEARAAHLLTKVDKYRHAATAVPEKAALVRGEIPEMQGMIAQLNGQIADAAKRATPGLAPSTDVMKLQVKARKLQQRAADRERKASGLELKAAKQTQRASELKVKADRLLEIARSHEQESQVYRQRADQLQMAAAGRLSAPDPTGGSAPPSPPQ